MARDVVEPRQRTGRTPLPRQAILFAVLLGTMVIVAGCAAGANTAAQSGAPGAAGFWLGVWHGIILPIAFIVSLFNPRVGIYEVHNSGGWYNFGFVLGIGLAISVTHGPRTRAARPRTRNRG